MKLCYMLLIVHMTLLKLRKLFKRNSDKSLLPPRKHLPLVKFNQHYYWIRLHQRNLSQSNSRKIAVSVLNKDTNQLSAGHVLKTHIRKQVLKLLPKPFLQPQNTQLPVLIDTRQDTLNNNVSRNATRQPIKMKSLMLCYWALNTIFYQRD
jgi:hypothetical protein